MRNASKNYQKYKAVKQRKTINSSYPLPEKQLKADACTNNATESNIIHNVQENNITEHGNRDTATNSSTNKQGLLHYFYLTKLFA